MQRDLLFSSYLRNGHTLGSLQQAPHRKHSPTLLLSLGRNAVKHLINLPYQLFFIISPSYLHFFRATFTATKTGSQAGAKGGAYPKSNC